MLGWLFSANCPVGPERKAWLEQGLNWLCGQFGAERMLRKPTILPTPDFFPEPYDKSHATVEQLFARVCNYIEVDRRRVKLYVYRDDGKSRHALFGDGRYEGAAGLYARESLGWETIGIEESQLDDPMALVGTMAHELAHVHLIGDKRLDPESPDHEPLTDLLTVLYGLGIFTANAVISESNWSSGAMSGWSVGRQGYLTGPEFGYSLALLAKDRGETDPEWLGYLRLDVRSACKQTLRFLEKNPDTLFLRMTRGMRDSFPARPGVPPPVGEIEQEFDGDRTWSKSRASSDEDEETDLDKLTWEK